MMRKPKRDGAYLAGQRDKGGSSLKARQRQTAKERAMAAKADRGSLPSISSAKNEEASFGHETRQTYGEQIAKLAKLYGF